MQNTISTKPLKGFRDFLGKDALKREWLRNKLTETFKKWGYEPMETPTLEYLSLFEGQIGEEEKLFYKFKDQGGRDVALRYDQTVPTCRVVSEYYGQLTFPYRRYQIQPAFRAENPQKGRYREFVQCDADIFGVEGVTADAEVIALSLDIYKELGFKNVQVLVNDRAMLKDIPYEAISSIDKLDKLGESGVIEDMIKKGINNDVANEYLDKVKSLEPNENISQIFKYLKDYGFEESWYKFQPTLARSFSYSSGPIWEVVSTELKNSMLGGERYDDLIEKISGKKIPGTGFGLGFDRTLEAAEYFGLIPDFDSVSKVLVTALSDNYQKQALETVWYLRNNDVSTEYYPEVTANLNKKIKYAVKKQIPFMIIIGEDEIKNEYLTVKDLVNSKQEKIKVGEVVKYINASNRLRNKSLE